MAKTAYEYKEGDPWAVCDLCGETFRMSELRDYWSGTKRCIDKCWNERHPQDFVTGKKDLIAVKDARPQPAEDTFAVIGPIDWSTIGD